MRMIFYSALLAVLAAADTYTDTKNGLMWQDNPAAMNLKGDWDEAMAYCKSLELGGFSDWRLPGVQELYTLVDINRDDPAITTSIKYSIGEDYWSSSVCVSDLSDAWLVYFEDGGVNHYAKSRDRHVRCVRTLK